MPLSLIVAVFNVKFIFLAYFNVNIEHKQITAGEIWQRDKKRIFYVNQKVLCSLELKNMIGKNLIFLKKKKLKIL